MNESFVPLTVDDVMLNTIYAKRSQVYFIIFIQFWPGHVAIVHFDVAEFRKDGSLSMT